MSLTIRKTIVMSVIGTVFLLANIVVVTNWLIEKGVDEKANWVRYEFLTGTAITVIVALLIFLVNPRNSSRVVGLIRRCPVCDKTLMGNASYCSECGSRVSCEKCSISNRKLIKTGPMRNVNEP